jgi:hypothetical protein
MSLTYASYKALTDTETRYAQIEKELLSVIFGLERFHQYTYGRTVQADTLSRAYFPIFFSEIGS